MKLTCRRGLVIDTSSPPQIMIESEASPVPGVKEGTESILAHSNNLAVCTILKLLRTIAIDGFRYVWQLVCWVEITGSHGENSLFHG